MFILIYFEIGLLVCAIAQFVNAYKKAGEQLAAEQRERYRLMELERLAADKVAEECIELSKQLAAVQYQIKLLEHLDGFRSNDFSNEQEVKKALAIEKQYNSLCIKERKLKQKLSALE